MKAITLWQPWSYAIAHLGKRVENRTWEPPAKMLGQRIAIHAASRSVCDASRKWIEDECGVLPPRVCVRGAIESVATLIGVATIDGYHCRSIGVTDPDPFARFRGVEDPSPWVDSPWFEGPFGWLLGDVVALPQPVPCFGAQGLWNLPKDIEKQVLSQVAA